MKQTTIRKKLDFIFWILVLLAMSVAAGFTTILVEKPLTPRNEYVLVLIVGTFGTILFIGLIAFGIYRWLKSNYSDVALKRALQVYGLIVTILLVRGSVMMQNALEIRNQFEYLESFRPVYMDIMMVKLEDEYPDNKVVKEHLEQIARCSYSYFDLDREQYQRFRAAKDKKAFILKDKYVKRNIESCIEMYSSDNPYGEFF